MKRQRVSAGQSLPLIALIIVIIIAAAGITIDTGNATSRQRTIDTASNAAAIASMNSVILQNTDAVVLDTLRKTLVANNVKNFQQVAVGAGWGSDKEIVYFTAEYLDASGAFLADVGSLGTTRPANAGAAHVVVKTSTGVATTFSRIAGVDKFTVSADGAAGSGPCVSGVYPITPKKIYLENNPGVWFKPVTMESLGLSPFASASEIPSLNTTNNRSPRFRVSRTPNNVGMPGNFSWTRWNGNASNGDAGQMAVALTGAGSLANGFAESTPPAFDSAALGRMNNRLEVGDWIAADTGNMNSGDINAALRAHVNQMTQMILPFHDMVDGNGNSGSGFRVDRFVKVRLLDFALTPANEAWFEFALIQDNAFCSTPETPPPPPTNGYPARFDVTEQPQWYVPAAAGGSYDIAVIMDFSYSMRFCWTTNNVCTSPNRRIDTAAGVMRSFVHEMLQVRNIEKGGDNRLALVTYSQTARQEIPFNNNTEQALTAFANFFGTAASPKTIDNSKLPGNTNTTDGLIKGISYLNGARTVDKYGKPVRLAVLLMTDGLTNVLNDGGYVGVSNRHNQAPFNCGETPEDMDNPLVQSTCPSNAEFPNINPKPLPPIKAMIKAANDARAAKPIDFYAVVMGQQNGLTPVDMHIHEVAPDRYYMANKPEQLQALVDSIEVMLGEPCTERVGDAIPAAGAKVTVSFASGGTVGTFTTNAQGTLIIPNLLPGTYKISVQHNGVIAGQDPLQIPRNYTRMIVGSDPVPVTVTTIVMPNSAYTAPPIKLVIDNPANAKCPD